MVSAGGSCTSSSGSVVMSISSELGGVETSERADGPAGAGAGTGLGLPLSSLLRVLLMVSISVARVDI